MTYLNTLSSLPLLSLLLSSSWSSRALQYSWPKQRSRPFSPPQMISPLRTWIRWMENQRHLPVKIVCVNLPREGAVMYMIVRWQNLRYQHRSGVTGVKEGDMVMVMWLSRKSCTRAAWRHVPRSHWSIILRKQLRREIFRPIAVWQFCVGIKQWI